MALFQVSNYFMPESGIAAVVVAGVLVRNLPSRDLEDLVQFKEQLTEMLIGLLFVLLAADVRLARIEELGWEAVIVVMLLMFLVRPITVFLCSIKADLNVREKIFMSWLAPRGIVAAAVASLFAAELARVGAPGGEALRALVFLVIAVTVTAQGLTGGFLARVLGLRRKSNQGYVILGAGNLAQELAASLVEHGEEVTLIDANAEVVEAAKKHGLKVVYGNGLSPVTLQRAGVDGRKGVLGLTPNGLVNTLFARTVEAELGRLPLFIALGSGASDVDIRTIKQLEGRLLFGQPQQLERWNLSLRRDETEIHSFEWLGKKEGVPEEERRFTSYPTSSFLPLMYVRDKVAAPVANDWTWKKGDKLTAVVMAGRRDTTHAWLEERGWKPLAERGTRLPLAKRHASVSTPEPSRSGVSPQQPEAT